MCVQHRQAFPEFSSLSARAKRKKICHNHKEIIIDNIVSFFPTFIDKLKILKPKRRKGERIVLKYSKNLKKLFLIDLNGQRPV